MRSPEFQTERKPFSDGKIIFKKLKQLQILHLLIFKEMHFLNAYIFIFSKLALMQNRLLPSHHFQLAFKTQSTSDDKDLDAMRTEIIQ